jgi:peptidoglycan/xylan/chitin deacetylase (PgdA/CDA1 family)
MKKLKVKVFIALGLAVLAGMFLHNVYSVPVLMYHSINEGAENSRLIVSRDTFEKQMHFLTKYNYGVLTMDEYTDLLKTGKKPARRSVVITFDDGYLDNYVNAYPVLKKYNIPAIIFVVVNWIGKESMMDLRQVRQLSDDPLIEIGSHGMSHCPLDEVDEAKAVREIKQSKLELESKLNTAVNYLCYPCGVFSPFIKKVAKSAGYKAALATHPDARTALDDAFAIRRIRISQSSDNMFIFWAQVSGYYTFFKDRRVKKR